MPHRPDLDAPSVPTDATVSLFFDLDGTLIDLAARPDAVVVSAALLAALARLSARRPGRVAILSGRSIAQLDDLLGPFARSVAVAGSHGAERRAPAAAAIAATVPPALAAAHADLAAVADRHGLLLERKSLGTALHFRDTPALEGVADDAARDVAHRHGLVLQRGKMMVEVRAPGDKGAALTALLATPAMAGTRPLFFGDDVTDEDGFVAAYDAGGAGVLVGPPRITAARHRLPDPAAVRAWIERAGGDA
ncbi:hypothetical protein ASG29_00550 [Sphingomonas sp. Leaf412]|nr:hypothetical protein ASG29_00550 [Sphingomonas sp. Leaf412]